MMITRNDLLPSTIIVGFIAVVQAATPVLVYYLWLKPDGLTTQEWTKNSWWVMWIGHLAAYGLVALFWPLSYVGGALADVYGWLWSWASVIGPIVNVAVFTFLLISGIYWPSDKTVWETLVVYFVS